MEEYAHRKNIERFERLLVAEEDPRVREQLTGLIERERQQLARVIKDKKKGGD